jgi:hypothetical protein
MTVMRRALRHLFTIISAISLLLCVATGVLWVRSFWLAEMVGYEGEERADGWQRGGYASSGAGSLTFTWWLRQTEGLRMKPGHGWALARSPVQDETWPWYRVLYRAESFDAARPASDGSARPARMTHVHGLAIPHALVVILFAALPAWWMFRTRRRWRGEMRVEQGLCVRCGYDLRAHAKGERCPECGAANSLAAV